MSSFDADNYRKIALYYRELGEKKLLKKSLSNINISKKVYLYYSRTRNIPICTLPNFRLILASKLGFLSFCYNFFAFINVDKNVIPINSANIQSIAKFVLSHEIGHILDPDISKSKEEYSEILSDIVDKIIEYDIDINNTDFHKGNIPYDLELCVLKLKQNLIARESKAWDIARDFLIFKDDSEKLVFNKMREYALATYNFGNLKNIVKEHNIDVFFKYKRYFK
ncbi:hypothetical protein [Faecalimicrobium dakarense]|uniref:hypothetical protein n=1 Tax=Faecalimicrobium dakarense TaxID=1301100 RepID=UPI0004BB5480|nr:hypothetical protein [[Clostridium] dakarense]